MNSSINLTEKEQNSFLLLADNSFYEKNTFCLMRREQKKQSLQSDVYIAVLICCLKIKKPPDVNLEALTKYSRILT